MNIEIRGGRHVSFPFLLKDAFREVFPSAIWNASTREWCVSKGAETRLAEWVAEVRKPGVLDEFQAQETARLAEQDVRRLEAALASIKLELSRESDATERAIAAQSRADLLAGQLEEMKNNLDRARETRIAAQRAARIAREAIMAKLFEVADVDEIARLRDGMKRDWSALKSANRPRFAEKQQRLREIRDQLTKIGLESCALNLAISANFNRRDRDRRDLDLILEFQKIGD